MPHIISTQHTENVYWHMAGHRKWSHRTMYRRIVHAANVEPTDLHCLPPIGLHTASQSECNPAVVPQTLNPKEWLLQTDGPQNQSRGALRFRQQKKTRWMVVPADDAAGFVPAQIVELRVCASRGDHRGTEVLNVCRLADAKSCTSQTAELWRSLATHAKFIPRRAERESIWQYGPPVSRRQSAGNTNIRPSHVKDELQHKRGRLEHSPAGVRAARKFWGTDHTPAIRQSAQTRRFKYQRTQEESHTKEKKKLWRERERIMLTVKTGSKGGR